mgnify:CR=1 FL=1|tara:strand:- start:106 stop:402 length:297 start_codon:yes stop_codon:yes gene_type:complete
MAKLNESSEFTIPLKNLLALVAATAISVWAYFGIMERLAFIEHDISMMQIEVEENDNWIDEFEPPPAVMNSVERVRNLEVKIRELELKLQFLVASRRG